MHRRGVNTTTDHKKMWGWILQPAGVGSGGSLLPATASGGTGRVNQMLHLHPERSIFSTLLSLSHSDVKDEPKMFLLMFWVVLVLFWSHWHLPRKPAFHNIYWNQISAPLEPNPAFVQIPQGLQSFLLAPQHSRYVHSWFSFLHKTCMLWENYLYFPSNWSPVVPCPPKEQYDLKQL